MSARRDRAVELVRIGKITPERACEHKRSYPSQNDARHAAKIMAKAKGRLVDTYHCPFDPTHYHLTVLKHGEDAA